MSLNSGGGAVTSNPVEVLQCTLRYWQECDASRLFELYRTHLDLHRQMSPIGNLEEAKSLLREFLPIHQDRSVFCLDIAGEACGLVGLRFEALDTASGKFDRTWVWYWSAGSARGKGLMKVAVKTVCDWAQARLDNNSITPGYELLQQIPSPEIRRLELGYRLNNPASAKVAEFAGFMVEGIERKKFKIDGELVDAVIAARL
ncbi:MAG: GNAT family protein [Arcanobacterium sp.]|nr:GNAT family protein [Arcanobacterium sp.]